jgi:hypothetical protein
MVRKPYLRTAVERYYAAEKMGGEMYDGGIMFFVSVSLFLRTKASLADLTWRGYAEVDLPVNIQSPRFEVGWVKAKTKSRVGEKGTKPKKIRLRGWLTLPACNHPWPWP